jgi:hypothetical protein
MLEIQKISSLPLAEIINKTRGAFSHDSKEFFETLVDLFHAAVGKRRRKKRNNLSVGFILIPIHPLERIGRDKFRMIVPAVQIFEDSFYLTQLLMHQKRRLKLFRACF